MLTQRLLSSDKPETKEQLDDVYLESESPIITVAYNPMNNPVGDTNNLITTTDNAVPSFWTLVSIIRQSFFPIYFIELTKAGINATNTSTLASLGEDEAAAVAFISSTVVLYCVAFPSINFYLFNLLHNNKNNHEIIIFYALTKT